MKESFFYISTQKQRNKFISLLLYKFQIIKQQLLRQVKTYLKVRYSVQSLKYTYHISATAISNFFGNILISMI